MLHILASGIITLIVLALVRRQLDPRKAECAELKPIPIVGLQKQIFPWARATMRSLLSTREWVSAGYKAYSRANQAYILPSLDRGAVVVLAPKQAKPIYSLPENILDAHNTQNETVQARWTFIDQKVADNGAPHINVIRNQMTRGLGQLIPILAAEISHALQRSWGLGSEWREITIWDSCLEMIAGAGNAVFCGAPLCRDKEFLRLLKSHGMSVFAGATLINATPKPLKPIVGSVVRLLCYYFSNRAAAKCLPLVKERLERTAKLRLDATYAWDPPKDALQWIIDECYATGQPAELAPQRVALRLLLLNVISLHSTSFTLQNVILDLASMDPADGVVELLREECRSVLAASGSTSWTYEAVKSLRLLDSAVRESMRLTPFANLGLPRTVVHPDGLVLRQGRNSEDDDKDDKEIRLPRGTMLALPLSALQRDETLYAYPETFDVFRFAQGKNNKAARSALAVDEGFMGFGFGQHACPGRFFAINEIKLVLAQMLLSYDIEHLGPRPSSTPLIWLNYPARNATVRVRRTEDGR
ncbi:cytochrome P450 [Aspergillus foveolatus]|uniref:cytochrome P450 n=1 Tax=Aspergillus foveolatus TaxID=210207 RepID=UPI003CCCE856